MQLKSNRETARYNRAFVELADNISVPYLNLFDSLIDDDGWLELLADGVHPTSGGYDRFCRHVQEWPPWKEAIAINCQSGA